MARRSRPHLHKSGQWRTRIAGREYWLGTDQQKAYRKFAELSANAGPLAAAKTATLVELSEQYGATCSPWARSMLGFFAGWLGDATPAECPRDISGFVTWLRKQGYSGWTIRHKTHKALAFLRWAHKRGHIARVPDCPKLPKPRRVARDLDRKELAALLAQLPERARRILRFITETGCRPGEACDLKWSMRRGDTFVLPSHKTEHKGQTRTIYLTPAARDIIEPLSRASAYVFLSRLGKPYTEQGLCSLLKRRKVKGGVYALRHTFAQFASETVPVDVLARMMGHADLKTTRLYYEVRDARALAGAKSLAAVAPPQPAAQPRRAKSPAPAAPDDPPAAASKRRRGSTSDGPDGGGRTGRTTSRARRAKSCNARSA